MIFIGHRDTHPYVFLFKVVPLFVSLKLFSFYWALIHFLSNSNNCSWKSWREKKQELSADICRYFCSWFSNWHIHPFYDAISSIMYVSVALLRDSGTLTSHFYAGNAVDIWDTLSNFHDKSETFWWFHVSKFYQNAVINIQWLDTLWKNQLLQSLNCT